jgi:hypothetical protein
MDGPARHGLTRRVSAGIGNDACHHVASCEEIAVHPRFPGLSLCGKTGRFFQDYIFKMRQNPLSPGLSNEAPRTIDRAKKTL